MTEVYEPAVFDLAIESLEQMSEVVRELLQTPVGKLDAVLKRVGCALVESDAVVRIARKE